MDGSDESKMSAHPILSFAIGVTLKKKKVKYTCVSRPRFFKE